MHLLDVQICAAFAGALLSLMLAAGISLWMAPALSLPLLLAPLGATAATLFGLLDSPPAQPRSVLGEPVEENSCQALDSEVDYVCLRH